MYSAQIYSIEDMCGLAKGTLKRTLTAMALQAYLHNKGSSQQDMLDVTSNNPLCDMAHGMQKKIYLECV